MVATPDSKSGVRKDVWVRVPLWAKSIVYIKKEFTLDKQEVQSTLYAYRDTINSLAARVNHATSNFETVMSYLNMEYEFSFSTKTMDLIVNIYSDDYKTILGAIKQYRPRLIVNEVKVFDGCCVLYIDFDNDWDSEPRFVMPEIETGNYSCTDWFSESKLERVN